MTLYHPAGESFELTASEWSNLLVVARHHGWHAAGAAAPAIRLDLGVRLMRKARWHGGYEPPEGQIVTGDDSLGLASALRKATRTRTGVERKRIQDVCEFCEAGGFLISCTAPVSAPVTAPLTHSGQLLNLRSQLQSQSPAPRKRQTAHQKVR